MRTRVGLIPKSNCETRKIRTRTQHVNQKFNKINYKEDKKTYPKLMLNILKVMGGPTLRMPH
jgi:hypothetical protein